ncbi:MAG: hypothetical protein ACI87E_003791 [Mariniblastus sp.]|jgi:hypothetical protein
MMKLLSRFTFHAVLFAVVLTTSFAQAQPGLQRALDAQAAHNPNFFANDGVVATGVSVDAAGNAIIKVYTKDGNVKGIPPFVNGVKVKKSPIGIIRAGNPVRPMGRGGKKGGKAGTDPKARQLRPVPIGVSIGTYHDPIESNSCFAGTLGCRLKREDTAGVSYFILSNNHVMAEQNNGIAGDQILQPGTLDSDCIYDPADQIGILTDFIPISFSLFNLIDAAIAETTIEDTGFASPDDAYGAPSSTTANATIGMAVQKFGRTTGHTNGEVDSINATVNVQYDSGEATFTGQVIIVGTGRGQNRAFSDSGDSGSLIVTQTGNFPVGLLFAGNTSVTIANNIDDVLNEFSLKHGAFFTVDDGN